MRGHNPATDAGSTPRQLLMREVNLRVFALASRLDTADGQYKFVCECGNIFCQRTITLHLHRFDPSKPPGSVLAHVGTGDEFVIYDAPN